MITIEDAMSGYLHGLKSSQSPQTVETYSQGVERFREFLIARGLSLTEPAASLKIDQAIDCSHWLGQGRDNTKTKLANATLHTYLASIGRFYKYLLSQKIIDPPAYAIEQMRDVFHDIRRGRRPLPKLPTRRSRERAARCRTSHQARTQAAAP